MEKNNLLTLVVTLTVGIILAGSMLMAVLADATATQKTFENDGLYYMTNMGADDSIVYTFDGTNWTINGEPATITKAETTIIAGEGVILRANGTFYTGSPFPVNKITSLTVTAEGMTGTVINSSNVSQSVTFSREIYYAAVTEETDYVMTAYNSTPYAKGNSNIMGYGWTIIGNVGAVYQVTGNIDDGFEVICEKTTMSISNVVCNKTEVDGYIDLYKITSITFDVTYDGNTPDDPSDDVTETATYTAYIAPAKVTAELSQHLDNSKIALLNTIPLLVIISLVMAAVGAIFLGNRD